MIAIAAGGLWVVLAYGNQLHAPQDLAGKWTLVPASQSLAGEAPAAAFGPGMTIEQSGRFFQVSFENGPRLNLKLDAEIERPIPGGQANRITLVGTPWQLTTLGAPDGDECIVQLTGPSHDQSGRWKAQRVMRTFPNTSKAQGSTGGH